MSLCGFSYVFSLSKAEGLTFGFFQEESALATHLSILPQRRHRFFFFFFWLALHACLVD